MTGTLFDPDDRGAHLSPARAYRHRLWRTWDPGRPPLGWIMLNPSTADAYDDDPTIRRCIGFARRDGYGGIVVANLFDLRTAYPGALHDADDPVGPHRDPWGHLTDCPNVVAAWGAVHRHLEWRVRDVLDLSPRTLWCVGTTQDGHPRHPLYVRADTPLTPWRLPPP